MDLNEEEGLVRNARTDPKAMQQLYNCYFPGIYAYTRYRIARVQDVEDLVGETFVRAFEQLDRFEWRGDGSFAAWLFRIAQNQIATFYRRSVLASPDDLDDLDDLDDQLTHMDRASGPDEVALQNENRELLQELIGSLSERRQEVVTLRYYGGLRNQQIAEVLGLDERTVASHLCRGLQDLHRLYHQQQDERVRIAQ